jgi:hypothetical protein
MSACLNAACHASPSIDSRLRFTNEPQAFSFAVSTSNSGSPSTSLFLRKPSGGCTVATPCNNSTLAGTTTSHGGGTVSGWGSGGAGFIAATNWINGGLHARNDAQPELMVAHRCQPSALASN